jgi:methionine sulfoxide reductase heme-binding subunit
MLKQFLNSHWTLWAALASPAVVILYLYWNDGLSYGEVIHASGEWAVRLLILILAVTPLRLAFPAAHWPLWLLQRRRALGVAVFGYALLHAMVYLARKQEIALILEEGAEWDLLTGWLALAVFLPLALTSNDRSVRFLKRVWKKLHRLVYPAAVLTFLHWMLTAFDMTPALIYAGILGLLEALRLILSFVRVRQRSISA